MPITPSKNIWMNGEMVAWDDAKIHVLSHSLHYGMGVFEGIRTYATDDGPAVFRLTDHIKRLHNSAKILNMPMPYSVAEIVEACKLVVRDSGLPECYVRPIAYFGYGEIGLSVADCTTELAIAAWPWGAYLGDAALTEGVSLKISSWARHDHNILPPASKTTGNYANSTLAKMEALNAGYDEAVMLNRAGMVSECTGENLFAATEDRLVTPPLSSGALPGITQDSVICIARDIGIDVTVAELARSDLYIAEEVFVCGTAAEVSAVNSVDDRMLRCPGPRTLAIAEAYAEVVRGRNDRYKTWNEHVHE
ncbi:MAG: branched-chain amino acid transaminase [Acidimicrobiaceae bacterium]|nr:branched-chain amino acid transaminase [Acidimicrobiaceae bacterium]MCY4175600.1 branched-chain amino acid transaminase [Acidimicrobiaceae bacterium]MCY4280918.1 branched-chain amino acid transaminase [Acidimicrobiaceae bacterium]MCY4294997.1 branched-chain amino acid transaminase [Acidimicrobiaceae bacterium]